MSNPAPGRHTILVGLDAPFSTIGFDPDAYALRVQQLMAELAPHASLDPALPINPYAEWWQSAGIGSLLYTRFALMSAAAVFTDGTVSLERFATLFATAFRESGAGRQVVVAVLVANMLRCETVVTYSADEFGGCCIQAPLTPNVVPLSIPGDRSGYRLLTRTARPQGVQNQPVPSGIAPTSLSPVPTQTPRPSVTPAYSGTVDDPEIPQDNGGGGGGGRPNDSGFPWLKVLGVGTVLAGGAFGLSLIRRRRRSPEAAQLPERSNPREARPRPEPMGTVEFSTFSDYLTFRWVGGGRSFDEDGAAVRLARATEALAGLFPGAALSRREAYKTNVRGSFINCLEVEVASGERLFNGRTEKGLDNFSAAVRALKGVGFNLSRAR